MAETYPIDVRIDPSRAVAGARKIKGELRGVQSEGRKTNTLLLSLFSGAAAAAGIKRSIGLLADFSQEMSTVRAVSRATEREFSLLQKKAESLGRTTRFSATQAAEGMTFLARAGFDANQVLGTIEGTLQLAQAGGLGLGRAADIASNALQGFQLEVEETGRVVDVLALAANSSNTSVTQLGDALSFAAPIASGLGVSIEEATAAIGALSNAGLQGSRAGTGLNRVLAELESPTSSTRKVLDELNVSVDDVRVSSVGLTNAIEVLADAGVTTGQALEIFGQRGGPAFDVLSKAIPDVREMNRELDNAAGTAKRVADTMDDNLNGAILSARSALEGFVLAVGNAGATDLLVAVFNGLATSFRFAADNADILTLALLALGVQAGASLLTPLTVSLYASATAAKVSASAFFAKTASLRASTVAMIAATGAARALGASLLSVVAANPVLIGLTVIAGAYYLLRDSVRDTNEEIQKADELLGKFRTATVEVERDTELLKRRNQELATAIEETGDAAQNAARLEIDAITKRISRNEDLKKSYRGLLTAQLALAKATQSSNDDNELSRLTGVERSVRIETFGGNNPRISNVARDTAEFRAEANAELEKQILLIREIQSVGGELNKQQIKILEFDAKRKEELNRILGLEEAISSIDRPAEKRDAGGAGGGGLIETRLAPDFEKEFAALQELTKAIDDSRAAQERANGVREFARQLERDLTDKEIGRVDAELRLQQVANDNQAQKQRIKDIQQETTLLSANGREAEILNAIYEAERESLLKLTEPQRDRIRSLIEEQQAVRDNLIINDRLDALDDESFLLGKVGAEAKVATEILRIQNQLERELTDTEAEWIREATLLNDEMERRNRLLKSAHEPAEQAKADMRSLIALYQEGKITLAQYNRELQNNAIANDVLSQDINLNLDGGDLGLTEFEIKRRQAEQLLRQQERGGVDDGSNQELFGLNANQLGVGGESERIRQETQERLELIRQARDAEILTETEFQERKKAILDQGILDQKNALLAGLDLQLASAETLFGSLTQIARNTQGEQSAIYKTIFAVEKAVAIARSIVAIQTGIAQAAALPFPANLGAMATVAASTASIVSNIQAVRGNFADGGIPIPFGEPGVMGGIGGPREDSNLIRISRGEGILTAEATSKNLGLFNALNADPDFLRKQSFMRGGIPLPVPANDRLSRVSGRSGSGGMVVEIHNYGNDKIRQEAVSPYLMRVIIGEAEKAVSQKAPEVIAADINDPYGKVSRSIQSNLQTKRNNR